MSGQLLQAQQNAVDVLWWTDHDHRMTSTGYRKTVHFTSLDSEVGKAGEGKAWRWTRQDSGALRAGSDARIVATPASPLDTVPDGSLFLSALTAKAWGTATVGVWANSHSAGWNYKGSLIGQSLSIEVLPLSIGPKAYLELRVGSSHHPASDGRPAGQYIVCYRFGGEGAPGSRVVEGLRGVVTLPVQQGEWNSITIRPQEDIAALWPELDSRDFALAAINLNAATRGGQLAEGCFDYLRFQHSSGEVQLQAQREMTERCRLQYPTVQQAQGLEVSKYNPHINWFGGGIALPDYGTTTFAQYRRFLRETVIPTIHSAGGIASYNHPFGATGGSPLTQSAQDQKLADVAALLLGDRVLGADIMEVGYRGRGGCDLAHHIGLWDVLSRNALFITGNGVNDDHIGKWWYTLGNNWITSVWSATPAEEGLLLALRAGRAWAASMSGYRGSMDVVVDGVCQMGSVSISSLPQRQLTAVATDLPSGGRLEVLQGEVDYAGAASPTPSTRVVRSYTAEELAAGAATMAVDTTLPSFVRTQVRNSANAVVGISNPVWLLSEAPVEGIPLERGC